MYGETFQGRQTDTTTAVVVSKLSVKRILWKFSIIKLDSRLVFLVCS